MLDWHNRYTVLTLWTEIASEMNTCKQVIFISNINHVYADSGGFALSAEGLSPGH
jgi:ABC-type transporter Mla MlaB component